MLLAVKKMESFSFMEPWTAFYGRGNSLDQIVSNSAQSAHLLGSKLANWRDGKQEQQRPFSEHNLSSLHFQNTK